MKSIEDLVKRAIKEGKFKNFKDRISDSTISSKLKNPINVNSPISLSVLSEEEWLRQLSHGWAKTQGGHYLEEIVALVSPVKGWKVQKIGNKFDLKNDRKKQTVMLKTQPSTANQSANMGDSQKAGQATHSSYNSFAIVFFKPEHAKVIKEVFGFSSTQIQEIKEFLVKEFRAAREEYETRMKAHPDYDSVVKRLTRELGW